MSGPLTEKIFREITSLTETLPVSQQIFSRLRLPSGEMLDEAMAVFFQGPRSFTGEDVAEFHLHGSRFLLHRFMEAMSQRGIRPALPGEFSFRAVRNQKMDLCQAQAVAELIESQSDASLQLALEKLKGGESKVFGDLGERLLSLAVQSELGLDFSDQDVEALQLKRLKEVLASITIAIETLLSTFERGWKVMDGLRLTIVGLPNAGKSSLLNALVGESRAIVSAYPGTTRDIVKERLTLRDSSGQTIAWSLEDTAGLRKAADPVEEEGIRKGLYAARSADLVLFVVDGTEGFDSNAAQYLSELRIPSERVVAVFSKADLGEASASLRRSEKTSYSFGVSSLTGQGIAELVDFLVKYGVEQTQRNPGETLITRVDQKEALEQSLQHLSRAAHTHEADLFAADLRQAIQALGPWMGRVDNETILAKLFSEFCIGK